MNAEQLLVVLYFMGSILTLGALLGRGNVTGKDPGFLDLLFAVLWPAWWMLVIGFQFGMNFGGKDDD